MKRSNSGVFVLALLLVAGLFSVAGAMGWLAFRIKADSTSTSAASTGTGDGAATPAPNVATPINLADVALRSDHNVDYHQLQDDLRQKDWRAADRETYLRLLDAAGPIAQATGMTPQSEMETFSCTDLRTVDQLWSAATDGQQGFTIQSSIFKAVGFDYRKLYDAVGWQKLPPSNQWAFAWKYNTETRRMELVPGKEPNYTNPPPGHLPTVEIGYNLDVAFSGALRRCEF